MLLRVHGTENSKNTPDLIVIAVDILSFPCYVRVCMNTCAHALIHVFARMCSFIESND